MSMTRAYTVFCNTCPKWAQSPEDQPLKSFRKDLRLAGWTRAQSGASHRRLIDRCPKCSKKESADAN